MTRGTGPSGETSPQVYARIGGLLYLTIILSGMASVLFVRGPLIVPGDAARTAANIAAAPLLWRSGVAADLLMHLCDVGLMLVFYVLLRPVSRNLTMLAILFNLVQTAVLVANKLNLMLPVFLSGDAAYLNAFDAGQRQALTSLGLRMHDYGFGFGLLFFGVECLILGYLIRRSGYLPRILGWMLALGGLSYLVNSFALILSPALANTLFPAILLPPLTAELSLALWLLFRGVEVVRWRAAAAIAAPEVPRGE